MDSGAPRQSETTGKSLNSLCRDITEHFLLALTHPGLAPQPEVRLPVTFVSSSFHGYHSRGFESFSYRRALLDFSWKSMVGSIWLLVFRRQVIPLITCLSVAPVPSSQQKGDTEVTKACGCLQKQLLGCGIWRLLTEFHVNLLDKWGEEENWAPLLRQSV